MKIVSLLRREGGTRVELFGQTYHFKPEDPADQNSRHICDVADQRAINRFMEIPEGYAPADEAAPPAAPARPLTTAPAQTAAPPAGNVPPPAAPVVADQAKVAEIRGLTIADLKAKLNTFGDVELRAALEAEESRTDEPTRKGFLSVIRAHLGE